MSTLGANTKTPELKQSGHPTSGAAENSSRSKSSSQFWRIYEKKIYWFSYTIRAQNPTKTSASKKTHFSNWVRFQQWSLVNVIPSSGRFSIAKLAASFESRTSTSWTTSNASCNLVRMGSVTPGVMRTASWCWVPTRRRELATTKAPREYESLVANVTHANPGKDFFSLSFLRINASQLRLIVITTWDEWSNKLGAIQLS